MKIVLDTNLFVSGIHWAGNPEKILISWSKGDFELVSSLPIVDELTSTLMNFKKPMTLDDIFWWRNLILKKSTIVYPKEKVNVVKDDPDDDKFIEAALEGNADYIVSQDNHLLKLKGYKGIKIIEPGSFLELLK